MERRLISCPYAVLLYRRQLIPLTFFLHAYHSIAYTSDVTAHIRLCKIFKFRSHRLSLDDILCHMLSKWFYWVFQCYSYLTKHRSSLWLIHVPSIPFWQPCSFHTFLVWVLFWFDGSFSVLRCSLDISLGRFGRWVLRDLPVVDSSSTSFRLACLPRRPPTRLGSMVRPPGPHPQVSYHQNSDQLTEPNIYVLLSILVDISYMVRTINSSNRLSLTYIPSIGTIYPCLLTLPQSSHSLFHPR